MAEPVDLARIQIRATTAADDDAVWRIFHEVVAAGDTYAFDPDMQRDAALAVWCRPPAHCFLATAGDLACGTYCLKANQIGLGDHVANAAFMVPQQARGAGVGRMMGLHAIAQARRFGFTAMQFNFVVSTNTAAVRLWRELGFAIVGTVPRAFRHKHFGPVDIHIMHRELTPP